MIYLIDGDWHPGGQTFNYRDKRATMGFAGGGETEH
jgi:hypothetical protein